VVERSAHRQRRAVHGVLLLDKAQGMTSNAALQAAKRLLQARKAGHSGTLDPLATGLLPVLFGEATKLAFLLIDADKTYLADVLLGTTTTTGDAEGDVVEMRTAISSRTRFATARTARPGTASHWMWPFLRETPKNMRSLLWTPSPAALRGSSRFWSMTASTQRPTN